MNIEKTIESKIINLLKKESVVIPRQAIGKYEMDVVHSIFTLLPLFSAKKNAIKLSKENLTKYLLVSKENLKSLIKKIEQTKLYEFIELENNSYEILKNNDHVNLFIQEVNKLECILAKNENETYSKDPNLSSEAKNFLKILLENKELNNIKTHFDFNWILTSLSFVERKKIEIIRQYLEELKKYKYFYIFDIFDKKNAKGIEKQIILVSNAFLSPTEAKKHLKLNVEEKKVIIYPIGEVQ